MPLREVTKFVFPVSEIPMKIIYNHWILEYPKHSFVEVHIDGDKTGGDPLSDWIVTSYPSLSDENSFFIHIDIPKDEQIN